MASSSHRLILSTVSVLALGLGPAAAVNAFDPGPPVVVSRNQAGEIAGWPCLGVRLARNNPRWLSLNCLFPLDDQPDWGIDTYLIDRHTGLIERVNVTSNGESAMQSYSTPGFPSDDGRYIVFESDGQWHPDAAPFPPGEEVGYSNIFLRDRLTGTTELVSRDSGGNARPGRSFLLRDALMHRTEIIMQTGERLLEPFVPGPTQPGNLYTRNWRTGAVEVISISADGDLGNGQSSLASYGALGRQVVLLSAATNLPGAGTSTGGNLFLRDRLTSTTTRLTRPWHGGEFSATGLSPIAGGTQPRLSNDGRFILFGSSSQELINDGVVGVHLYLLDLHAGAIERVSVNASGQPGNHTSSAADMSDDGRYIAVYSQATNLPAGRRAIYVIDRHTGEWLPVTQDLGGHLGGSPYLDLASDGSIIAFTWRSDDISQPDLYDRLLVYTVDLGIEPAGPGASPRPVPTGSRTAWLLLVVVVLFATFRVSRDLRRMDSR